MIFAFISSQDSLIDSKRDDQEISKSEAESSKSTTRARRRERWYKDEENEFIDAKISEWQSHNFKNTDLWKQFKDDFDEWTEENFRTTTIEKLKKLRTYLRQHDV